MIYPSVEIVAFAFTAPLLPEFAGVNAQKSVPSVPVAGFIVDIPDKDVPVPEIEAADVGTVETEPDTEYAPA